MQVINKKNFVKDMLSSLELQTTIEVLFFIVGIIFMVNGIYGTKLFTFFVGSAIFVLFGYLFQEKIMKARIWRSGLKGQNLIEQFLSPLDDKYHLINNLSLPFKNCDIDHLLIGPKGVFLIETKHYKGEISCIGDSWRYQKVGKNGGIYKGYINNPSRQLKRNVWEMKTFLDKKSKKLFNETQFPFWIQGMVVFTNEEAQINIKEETVKVLKVSSLLPYIRSFGKDQISFQDIQKIVKVLAEI